MTTHERQEYAAQLKREMNCCQAVVRAFDDTLDMPVDKLRELRPQRCPRGGRGVGDKITRSIAL